MIAAENKTEHKLREVQVIPSEQPGVSRIAVVPRETGATTTHALLESSSLRFALGLWLGSAFALYVAYFLQLEPAGWAGVIVCFTYLQTPRLNYAKVACWCLGTIAGAMFAVILIATSYQDRWLFLGGLAFWVGACAYASNLMKHYSSFTAVLAGFTAAIVSLSAINAPEQVFPLAVSRVSCVFVGLASAVIAIKVFLPAHPHWKETINHFGALSREVFTRSGESLRARRGKEHEASWVKLGDHLAQVEHTLSSVTAESADSRIRAQAAKYMLAWLFNIVAKAQSIEECLAREETKVSSEIASLLDEARILLQTFSSDKAPHFPPEQAATAFAERVHQVRLANAHSSSDVFILLRLEDVMLAAADVETAWEDLQHPRREVLPSAMKFHRDQSVARVIGYRATFTMAMGGIFWVVTGWPAGPEFVMFAAVVASILSLQEDARNLGLRFLKGLVFCTTVAFFDRFCVMLWGEGFLLMALALGLFLVPAAYLFRKPNLRGGAGPSMLFFYILLNPTNQMTYDLGPFLNSAIALIFAAGFAHFAFFAILPPAPSKRCSNILKAIWSDLQDLHFHSGHLAEQRWVSLLSDRIRLLHRFSEPQKRSANDESARIGLQLGLRVLRLEALAREMESGPIRQAIRRVLKFMRRVATSPEKVHEAASRAYRHLKAGARGNVLIQETLAELAETRSLLEAGNQTTMKNV